MTRPTGFILTTVLFLGSLAAIGYWLLFSNFAVYDDEGYVLITVREYFAHGRLYAEIYSQYGPAFYVLMDFFQRLLGSPVDHTSARLLTLGLWLGNAGCCGLLVWRQTAARSLTLFTLAATFLYLFYIVDEPFHPGSLIFFTLAASLLIVSELITRGRWAGAAAVAGGTGAILLLTKINVGAFYLVGVGAWVGLHAASDRVRRVIGPWIAGGLILFAIALMKPLLREAWVQIYLALFAVGAITLVAVQKGAGFATVRQARWFGLVGTSLGLAILAAVWVRGTSLAGLVEGVLLGPLRHPLNYSYPVDWRPGSLLVAGLSLALALAQPWIRRRFSDDTADRLIVALRLGLFVGLLIGFALLLKLRVVGAIFSYVAPLIWIWVIPLKGVEKSPAALAIRGLLAAVLLLQFLHAYPVGGSQVSWGTFLFMPLVALGLGDVRQWLALRRPAGGSLLGGWSALAALTLGVLVAKVGATALTVHGNYAARATLDLPGASGLRLPAGQRDNYRILTLNAAVHADLLFSMPGMFSFNVWSDRPAPTGKNTTLWFTLLNDAEQQAIIHALEQSPRAVIIEQESLMQLMQARDMDLAGPLREYLERNFAPAFKLDGFAFLVRTGRAIAPLNLAEVSVRHGPDPTGLVPDTRIDFCLVHDGSPVATIEVRDRTSTSSAGRVLNAANAQLSLTAIDRSGRAMALPSKTPWPLQCHGLARVSVQFNRAGLELPARSTVLYLKGTKGETLGKIRLGE